MKLTLKTGLIVGFTIYCALVIAWGCLSSKEEDYSTGQSTTYVGSDACKSCHTEAYTDWKMSDHYLAMQPANDSTVLGDFNNTSFTADGVTNAFFKRDGKFYINTQGDDGLNHDYEILYTFGYFPLQQYLIAFPGGRMQTTRVSWDSREKKWFHQYTGQEIHYKDWFHWTGNSQNWNTMCASCHSTDLKKNYDFETDAYHTTWNEINVSCESCHGPGSAHIAFVQSKAYEKGEHIKYAGLWYGRDTISQLQLNTCAPCHARKSDVSPDLIHSGEIMDDLIPQVIMDEHYFADGQIKSEDYEYGSFTQSKMFAHNVRCSNCHNPHSGKLRLQGNNLCLSCHKPDYALEEHHFHKLESEGAQCVNCHMATTTYMGNDHRRDHSFRVPRPDQSVIYGTPNACNSCHTDKSATWSAEVVEKWYGPERKPHFSDDLIPGSLLNDKSEFHLVKLLSDTTQPEMARATAAYYMGNLQTMGNAQALLNVQDDPKPLVRYHAIRSLENYPPEIWQSKVYAALSDEVRAVRIAAADLYHRLPGESVPADYKDAYDMADKENIAFLQYQTDFSIGNVMMGDYKMQGGAVRDAIMYYNRGLKKDSLMNYARMNLATAYNSLGQNQEALKTLLDASVVDPFNDQVFYNLGLLYYELGEVAKSLVNFKKAEQLGSDNPGLYYNYGLALQQQGKLAEAERILLKGYDYHPQAINLNYALAFLYMQQKLPGKARKHAEALHYLDPDNPEYQQLFRDLGM
ncbi:MAG TPA: tetratricopeptide repeat protein [Saprospiraceae bacterium]